MVPFPCVMPRAKLLTFRPSDPASSEPSTSIKEFTDFMIDDMRNHPFEVLKALLLSILAICIAWLFFATMYALALRFGVLDSPEATDLEAEADEVVDKDWSDFDEKMAQWTQYTRDRAGYGRCSDGFMAS